MAFSPHHPHRLNHGTGVLRALSCGGWWLVTYVAVSSMADTNTKSTSSEIHPYTIVTDITGALEAVDY
eukprot:scaffold450_cov116-Skeletonema_dohrnii-CCMP3373.AAC.3